LREAARNVPQVRAGPSMTTVGVLQRRTRRRSRARFFSGTALAERTPEERMNLDSTHEPIEPVAANNDRNVQVLATTMRIRDLNIERPAIVAYLQGIVPEKQEIALVHAIEVGITEMLARRERLRH
jgi:hypothetical protein